MSKLKSLLLYSGGLDSTAILYSRKNDIDLCVFFDYKSKHNKVEYSYAKKHCKKLNKKMIKINLPMPFESALTSNHISAKGIDNKNTVVPFRNGIFLAYAVALCEEYNLNCVLIGVNNPASTIYKDTTAKFIKLFNTLVQDSYKKSIQIINPLQGLTKVQVGMILKHNNVHPDATYSCYEGKSKACGKCSACLKRRVL